MEKKIKVLYVDDDFLNLMSFEVLFKDIFFVFTAPNVNKALDIFNNNDISIIITDQKMPNNTGVTLLKEIYKKNNKTLRIILSGYIEDKEIYEGLNQGIVNYFLDKPLNERVLLEIIEKFCKEEIL